jgi:hypothetical protein
MERTEIDRRLQRLDEQIEKVKMRLPAHSVKPPIMMELLALEDERDALVKTLQTADADDRTEEPR